MPRAALLPPPSSRRQNIAATERQFWRGHSGSLSNRYTSFCTTPSSQERRFSSSTGRSRTYVDPVTYEVTLSRVRRRSWVRPVTDLDPHSAMEHARRAVELVISILSHGPILPSRERLCAVVSVDTQPPSTEELVRACLRRFSKSWNSRPPCPIASMQIRVTNLGRGDDRVPPDVAETSPVQIGQDGSSRPARSENRPTRHITQSNPISTICSGVKC